MIAFADLYTLAQSRLPDRLRRLKVPPEDVDDIVHDVVLIAHRSLGRFAPRRADLQDAILAWLYGIAWRHVSRQRTRARWLKLVPGGVTDLAAGGDTPSPEDLAAHGQRRALVLQALRELRPERALVLVLHTVGEMHVPEIAGTLKINENTVKSRLIRARRDARISVRWQSRAASRDHARHR